ncbi:MAG: hypothetical protein KJZ85_06865 [Rhodobacteraceae bacterium]|jgi:hypothetical protein|nr:hypothetical protein [Paracoccaceae bacterium]
MATARATPRPASARPGQGTAGRAAAALLAVALPAAGTAQPAAAGVETRSLYAAPGWAVVLGHDTDDGTLWCAAETANRRDQALHLMMLGDGRAGIAVVDSRWALEEGPVAVLVEVDRAAFPVQGFAAGTVITVLPSDPAEGRRLVAALAVAATAALRDSRGGWVAGFSLPGIGPAAAALADCAAAIAPPGAPPPR